MSPIRSSYPSDLTDPQWEVIKSLIPPSRSGGRRRSTDVRLVLNAVFYLIRTGVAWRYLPAGFPPWKTVYDYFWKCSRSGLWSQIRLTLTQQVRTQQEKRNPYPSLAIADSQTIRSAQGKDRGYDPAKKVLGRKRNILVDTLGLIWGCQVHAANISDARGGLQALRKVPEPARASIQKIIGDQVYPRWPLDYYAHTEFGITVEGLNKRITGTNLKPKRWIVERTFAWMNHFRRLSRDYERRTQHSESMIYLVMIVLTLNRLFP